MDPRPTFVACASEDRRSLSIQYDLSWLLNLMRASSGSMVPFTCFSLSPKIKTDRSYPRSYSTGFTIEKTVFSEDSAGGRLPTEDGSAYAVCELLSDEMRALPLADIAILSKRNTILLVQRRATRLKHLNLLGGSDRDSGLGWQIFGYPMLCVMAKAPFPKELVQGYCRLMQCVFAAALTREIRSRGIGLEVVAREGFGSLFPTLADLPQGIRLDPGLLPPEPAADAIAVCLTVLDDFLGCVLTSKPSPKRDDWVQKMNGMGAAQLNAVDRLTHLLHEFAASGKGAGKDYAVAVAAMSDGACMFELPPLGHAPRVGYSVACDGLVVGRKPREKAQTSRDTGYGSESDDEDDAVESTPLPPPRDRALKSEADVGPSPKFLIRKYSVISGMAALNMAVVYGAKFSSVLLTGHKQTGIGTWAQYFELEMFGLFKQIRDKVGVNVLVCDGAPNPINIPEPSTPINCTALAAVIVDTTNNTTREKARFLAVFKRMLAPGGIVILVDSASKHPTGGDLVHGILRVYGSPGAVEQFDAMYMQPHLSEGSAWQQTLLNPLETEIRKLMLVGRLVMRNRDLFESVGT